MVNRHMKKCSFLLTDTLLYSENGLNKKYQKKPMIVGIQKKKKKPSSDGCWECFLVQTP